MGSAEWRVSVPVGVKFQPTDEELVDHYLKRKMEDEVFEDSDIIPEIDVCKYDPWDLPGLLATVLSSYHAMELFFFSPRDYKYTNSTRANRRTPNGYWKPTGEPRVIKDQRYNVIAKKRTLTFYRDDQSIAKQTKPSAKKTRPTASKTNWVMHQYDRIESANRELVQRDFLICRVKQKWDKDTSICDEGELSTYNMPIHEYQDAGPEYYSSSVLQSPTCTEPGVLLQANGNNNDYTQMQSPFGNNNHFATDTNDISTCGEGDLSITMSDFQNEVSYDMFPEPYHGHDYCSSASQSPLYTNHGNFLHDSVQNQECSMRKSTFCDNRSIIYDEQDNNTPEVYPQLENLASIFRPFQVQDYTLLPLGSTNEGDVLHDNNLYCLQ